MQPKFTGFSGMGIGTVASGRRIDATALNQTLPGRRRGRPDTVCPGFVSGGRCL
jgi:hypothetical protein